MSSPSLPILSNDQLNAQLYLDGPSIVNNYQIRQGVCILPLAEDPPEDPALLAEWSPVVALRLHSPYRIRTARFGTKKQMAPPILPSPGDVGAFVFSGGSLEFTNIPNTGETYDWICKTEFTYVENCVSRTIDGFVLGNPGFTYPSQQANADLVRGVPAVPPYGAIYYASLDPKIGYVQSQFGPSFYNTISYFPGLFFNDYLMNGWNLYNTETLTAGPAPFQPFSDATIYTTPDSSTLVGGP